MRSPGLKWVGDTDAGQLHYPVSSGAKR